MTRMHLMWFCAFSPHAGFGLDGWAGPRTTGYEWTRPELWQDMAVALERAKFDLIMLGDSLAVPGTYQGRMDAYLRYAEHAPFHDPGPLVAIMAAATRRIGLAATLSTTFYPPFLLARLMTYYRGWRCPAASEFALTCRSDRAGSGCPGWLGSGSRRAEACRGRSERSASTPSPTSARRSASPTSWRVPSTRWGATASPSDRASGRATSDPSWRR